MSMALACPRVARSASKEAKLKGEVKMDGTGGWDGRKRSVVVAIPSFDLPAPPIYIYIFPLSSPSPTRVSATRERVILLELDLLPFCLFEQRGPVGKMSWQSYVDDHLMCEIEGHHLTSAAILGHDGTVWAQSADFPAVCVALICLLLLRS
jgi:hypothetical protein